MSKDVCSPSPSGVTEEVSSSPLRARVQPFADMIAQSKIAWQLARLRSRTSTKRPGVLARCLNYSVRINDGWNFYILYKDIFLNRIYHFEAERRNPYILDCGSNIGMSILYFKHLYPEAHIVGFEPDPAIFPYLEENITRNRVSGVELVRAALAKHAGTLSFYSDGKYGSYLARGSDRTIPDGWKRYEVPAARLREYLHKPVDFLKMNIEGAEWEVLEDSEDQLAKVKEMVIEYHHLPGLPRTLHRILELLHRNHFEYLINDFDRESNGAVSPPFQLTGDTRYFLLVYAKREG